MAPTRKAAKKNKGGVVVVQRKLEIVPTRLSANGDGFDATAVAFDYNPTSEGIHEERQLVMDLDVWAETDWLVLEQRVVDALAGDGNNGGGND